MSKKAESTALATRPKQTAIARVEPQQDIIVRLIELARDPSIDIAKINALIDTNQRVMEITAKRQFDAAFAKLQGELVKKPVHRGGTLAHMERRFATFADILKVVGEPLANNGFSLRFKNAMSDKGVLTITGILAHAAGHREEDQFQTLADNTGNKNDIQAIGSARQYGMRYVTRSLLRLADAQDEEDDGAAAGRQRTSAPREEPRRQPVQPNSTSTAPTAPTAPTGVISEKQIKRAWAIIKHSGRSTETVKAWLLAVYGIDSLKKIPRADYEVICKTIEAAGPLPVPTKQPAPREAGEEG